MYLNIFLDFFYNIKGRGNLLKMATVLVKRNMRLFGLPYQFLPEVDPRIPTVSNIVGRKFAENIILDAPVVSIIPGKPKYLPGSRDKYSNAQTLLSMANDNFEVLKGKLQEWGKDNASDFEVLRIYDFERAYTEYTQYVNILCRTCATFLELDEEIDGVKCQRYDYSKYKWNTGSLLGDSIIEKIVNSNNPNRTKFQNNVTTNGSNGSVSVNTSDTMISSNDKSSEFLYETTTSDDDSSMTMEELLSNYNYVQFFVDSDVSANESMSNATTESKIKSAISGIGDTAKEVAFLMNSGGIDASKLTDSLAEGADSIIQNLSGLVGGESGSLNGILERIGSLATHVAKGDNMVMPDIYQNSSYDKSYSFTVHLKTPYGTKFGYFMDICVPLMHLIALTLPKQSTANTYGSPFLVRAFCEGLFTCNMGIIQSMSITKGVNGAFSVDGLPTEIDVTVQLMDLYSDLSMSPQNNPLLFINNSSLIEYLSTTCGLSLVNPNFAAKLETIVNSVSNMFADIPDTIMGTITEALDGMILDFLGLTSF